MDSVTVEDNVEVVLTAINWTMFHSKETGISMYWPYKNSM